MFKSLFFALFWHLWLCWRASYFISDHLLLKNLLRTLHKSDQHSISMLTLLNQAQRTWERGNDQQVKTELSLKGRGWEFLLPTMNMALGYFHRKIEPKEIPSCFIPNLLVVFTRQLEILVTSLRKGSWLVIKFSLLTPYAMYREQYGEDAFWKYGYYALILIQ